MISKSINYWSYPGGLDGSLPVLEFLQLAQGHGFDAVELCVGASGDLTPSSTERDCFHILEAADKLNIRVASIASGLYWSHALGDSSESSRKQAQEELQSMLRITSWLKAKTLLTIPGAVDVFFLPDRPSQPYAEVEQYAREGLKEAAALAERLGVRMGIENVWNKFLLSPQEMKSFVESCESRAIGAYVDVANILPYGYPQDWLRHLGPLVFGVHFKDYRRSVGGLDGFVDLLEGDVNWREVMTSLREIQYDGPVVAEMIPLYAQFPLVRCQNTSSAMDAILGRS